MSVQQETYHSQSLGQIYTPPKTPPHTSEINLKKIIHPWPEPETEAEEVSSKRRKVDKFQDAKIAEVEEFRVSHQEILLLHAPKQKYAHTKDQPIHVLKNDREMLVAVEAVGLNPIDWKAP